MIRFSRCTSLLRCRTARVSEQLELVPVELEPDPYAPFRLSQGIRVGNLLFVSGQAAIAEDGSIVGAGDFDAQAEQTFRNLRRVLEAGGSSLDRVVKVTIYLTDMSNFPKIVELRGRWFTSPWPADTIVEVSALALPELEIEIEAVALASA
jgi:2-iminobutanoate/2-iminopropanoate deaminase